MNDILLLKKDLETYASSDIQTLAKYYHLSSKTNYTDLLWLLAIKIGGQRASMVSGWPIGIIEKTDTEWLIEGEANPQVPKSVLERSYKLSF